MRRHRALLVLTAAALLLRLLHLHAASDLLLTEPDEVGMDRWLAMRTGAAVADGDWLGGWTADYDSAPGYGYWIGLLYAASGGRWLPALVLQCVLGAAVVPLVFAVGRRLFSERVGLVAAVFAALYAPAVFYETLLVKFSLVPVAVAALLLATDRARVTGTATAIALAGLVLGLLIAVRGNAAAVTPVIVWWIVARRPSLAAAARAISLLLVGAVAIVGPLAVRDRIAAREGRGTSLWGIHFYIASHPAADGAYAPAMGVTEDPIGHVVDARRIAEEAAGRSLSPAEVSSYWMWRGIDFARAAPWRYAQLQARKIRLALAGFEEGTFGDDFDTAVEVSWVLRLPLLSFGALCPLGIVGLFVAAGRGKGQLLGMFVGVYLLSLLPFFVTGRYRLPIVVPIQLLAANGLVWLDVERRRHGLRGLLLPGAAMALLSFGLPAETSDRWGLVAVLTIGLAALGLREPNAADQSAR
jgi:hypothetical protein